MAAPAPLLKIWRIETEEGWHRLLKALGEVGIDFSRPLELVVRRPRDGKTDAQRRLFHAICGEMAPQLGLHPGQAKNLVKSYFYGIEKRHINGKVIEFTGSSEESDRQEYSNLIEAAFQLAAEAEIVITHKKPAKENHGKQAV